MHRLSFIIFLLVVTSCKQAPVEQKFIIELPGGNDSMDVNYRIKKYFTEQLHLSQLEKGSDSIEFRIWQHTSISKNYNLYIIKRQNNGWQGTHYSFLASKEYKEGDAANCDLFTRFKSKIDSGMLQRFTPLQGWDAFITKLFNQNILSLPSQQDIKDFKNAKVSVADGERISIEYATQNKYKFYSYHCPDVYDFPECKQMTEILKTFYKNGLHAGGCK